MRKWIKVGCFLVAGSLLAGGLVYVVAMAMYRLADALSVSPALKNLAPLAAIGVVWFIVSRAQKYFQRLSERVFPSSPEKEEQRRQAWLRMRAKGKRWYIWRYGVIRWGLPVFAIFTPSMFIVSPGPHEPSVGEIVGFTIFSFLAWAIGGYFFGLAMWKTLDNRYR